MYSLRYYCRDDAYWQRASSSEYNSDFSEAKQHEEKLHLLELIRTKHNVDFQLWSIPSTPVGIPDKDVEWAIYQEQFIKRAGILKPRLRESVREAIRAKESGNTNIVNRIAVIEDGQVGWVTGSDSSWRRFLPSPRTDFSRSDALYFLEAVLAKGQCLLNELCFDVKGAPEQRLVERFIASKTLNGIFDQNVWLLSALKQADLICECQDATWVIEAKTKLTWEAFGQALGYSWYYHQEHPDIPLRSGIVCGDRDPAIERLCAAPEFAVTVFVETSEGCFERRGFAPEKS